MEASNGTSGGTSDGAQDILEELEAQTAGGPGQMSSQLDQRAVVPKATPYGPSLSVEDQEQQWASKHRTDWEEIDLLLAEVQSSGDRISEYGAWYAKVKDAPPSNEEVQDTRSRDSCDDQPGLPDVVR